MLYKCWDIELLKFLAAMTKRDRPLGTDMGLCGWCWEGPCVVVQGVKMLGSACRDSVASHLPRTICNPLVASAFSLENEESVVTAQKICCEDVSSS